MNKEEWLRVIKKFRENGSAMLGLILMIIFIIVAILAPVLAPVEITENLDLKKAEKLISDKGDKAEILKAFNGFKVNMYSFYNDNLDNMLLLEKKIKAYKANNKQENELVIFIKSLTDNYIIDQSYTTKWDDEKKTLIKDLKKEIQHFKKMVARSKKVEVTLEELNSTGNDFYKKAKVTYDKMFKIYKKSINIDPYVMANVIWSKKPVAPSKEYIFGISDGKDIYYGVIWGTRVGFKIGFIVVLISTIFGLFIGSISAYYGGWVDEVLMRITDVFLSIPFFLAAIVLTTMLGTGLDKVMIAMITFRWMAPARLIRGNILQTKNEQYVLASQALGVPDWKIIIKHILPNTIFPVIILASMRMGSLVITAAALSFLGIGAPQGYADWGSILSYARNWMMSSMSDPFQYWYLIFFPGTAMVLFVLSWNLIGDALRDIFDPKLRL